MILKIFNKSFSKVKFIISLVLFVLFFIAVYSIRSFDEPINNIDTSIIVVEPDSLYSSFTTRRDIIEHNKEIISLLKEREATASVTSVSRESDSKQTRTIYVAVLVVFISIIFNNNKNKLVVSILLISFILIMYWAEKHTEDLLQRGRDCTFILYRSTEVISNSKSLNSLWYDLDYEKFLDQQKKATANSFERKIWAMSNPDGEQLIIYCVPFIISFLTFFYQFSIKSIKIKYPPSKRRLLNNK